MGTVAPIDAVLFVALPYAALVLFFVGTIVRYRSRPFSYSSLSSQFLENRHHFWAQVPFHYGILYVLAGHVVAFLFPRAILGWNAAPARLYLLEATGLAAAALAFVGLVNIVLRRAGDARSRVTTTPADWVVYALLVVQIATGMYVATTASWGSSWFASVASPYLRSLAMFAPEPALLVPMPLLFKVHVVGLWVLLGVFPFTRLVHVLVVPNPYLWRRPQVVRWYGIRRAVPRRGTARAR
ncbi:MAG: respiratory nitrate reductase subunit gamma [Planctomycetia bacterium]|nr:respiratory nitrate reductase subunit gamma [Planctomycetia bacterium]